MIAPRDGDGNFASPCLTCSSSLRFARAGTDLGFQAGGARDKRKKKFQIRIYIVLINYQPRQIPKNHCFLIY